MIVQIGEIPIHIRTDNPGFQEMLNKRYRNFITPSNPAAITLSVELLAEANTQDLDLAVSGNKDLWTIQRGDFFSTYNPTLRQGNVRQTANPWSIDALIRIIHSLELARNRGFLLHAASAIVNKRAFIFTGASGAGKTTISRLAPKSASLLTDEISCIRREGEVFRAWGTPFAGELATPGDNVSAPIAALYFLRHAPENRIAELSPAEALHRLMKNILFFAEDPELVQLVFSTAAEFLERTPVFRLEFKPDASIWDLIS
jgi:hypothetical protein